MHETAIITTLIEQVAAEIGRAGHPDGRVKRLEVVVGAMSGVCPESLAFAFEILSPGTCVESARLTIERRRAQCRCASCDEVTEVDEFTSRCPSCGQADIRIEGGQELLLQSIEIEDD